MRKTEEDIIKEATLNHFELQGFECRTEITGFGDRRPDVIAWNKLTNTVYAVECKGSSLAVLYQAIGQALPYKTMAHEVFVSVPDKTFRDKNFRQDFIQEQCDKLSINILFFDLKTKTLSNTVESSTKNTEFKKTLIEKLRKKFHAWIYDVFDEHPEYYREIVRILSELKDTGTIEDVFKEFTKLKGKGTDRFIEKYPNMRKSRGFRVTKKNYVDMLLGSSKILGLVTNEGDIWKLTPVGSILLQNINLMKADALTEEEELIFKVLAFKPVLCKDIYEIVGSHPNISKKELSHELGKVLPRYSIKHDPKWFVDRLALFLCNCGILESKRTRVGNVYKVKI